VSTLTPAPLIPTSTVTQIEHATLLLGPAPYPTPGGIVVPWEQLIKLELIGDIEWANYQGELRGNGIGGLWPFSFEFPIGWYVDPKSDFMQQYIQNIPMTQDPEQYQFLKFEIVRLSNAPMIEEGHAVNPKELITVKMAGEPAVLHSVTQQKDQKRQINVILHHEGGWLIATGYIALPKADEANLDKSSAIIYTILSSFRFTDQVNASTLPTPTPSPVVVKKLADSEFPAAGICDASPDNPVLIKIAIGSMPDPRCIKVTADQRVEFQNETGLVVRIQLGRFDVTFPAGDIITLDAPCGEYLEPGVHRVTLSQGSVPEIWLITK